jgi:hypothetical protein
MEKGWPAPCFVQKVEQTSACARRSRASCSDPDTVYANRCCTGGALIEFPLANGRDNMFGHLSVVPDLDYWVVPELSALREGVV